MTLLPNDYGGAWTLASTIQRSGIGLHSGLESTVRLLPSDQPGFYLSWSDNAKELIRLSPEQSRDTQLCTTLELGTRKLSTVEHLLAALAGCGLTHVHLEVSGHEIPLLDGSALGWVEAILEAGISSAPNARLVPPVVKEPLVFNRGNSVITATPAETFSLVGMVDFPYAAIGRQMFNIELTPSLFVQEIAPARTFGFVDQIENLKKLGLIRGGTLDNALVCDSDHWINPPLRFENEPVRHKLLDLIGDLALVGFPKAQVLVYRGSHGLHNDLAAALLKSSCQ